MHIPISARVMQRFRFSRRERTHLARLSFAERAINGSCGAILHSPTYELPLRMTLGHKEEIFMKIKKKAKRISSVALCAYAFNGSSDYSRNRKCITTIKTGATVIYTISFTAIIALLYWRKEDALKNKKIYIAIIAALIVAIGALSAVLIYNNINSQPAALGAL